jgi:hypothetical protein
VLDSSGVPDTVAAGLCDESRRGVGSHKLCSRHVGEGHLCLVQPHAGYDDRLWSTAGVVVGVAAVAAVVSYEHASALVRAHGESGRTARLIPLTVDGLIYASSMAMLDSARRGVEVPALARWLLGLGIAATLAANVAHGLGHGPVGAAVGAWPAVALVGSYELLMMIIYGAQIPADADDGTGVRREDPLHEQAARAFADELAAARIPSVRVIRARLHVGQLRAQRIRAHLAALAST